MCGAFGRRSQPDGCDDKKKLYGTQRKQVIVFDLDTLRWGSEQAESPYFDRNTARLSRTRFRSLPNVISQNAFINKF